MQRIGLSAMLLAGGLLPAAGAGCGAANLEEPEARPAVVATLIVPPAAAAPTLSAGNSHVLAPAANADEPAPQVLDGTWAEEFESRFGCQDKIEIAHLPRGLKLSGNDCNDGEPYDFKEAAFDGQTLRVRVVVPSTQYVLDYRMRMSSGEELEGEVDVKGGGSSTTYNVRWVRETER